MIVVVYLLHATLRGVAPFGEIELPFRTADGQPRLLTIVHGGAGVGKTALLTMIAAARPGHEVVVMSVAPSGDVPPHAMCEWYLGHDDPERPHPLFTVTPNAPIEVGDEEATLRRREQGLFDRRAKRGGFVVVAFPATRWFSRQPVSLHAPLRSIGRYDVRTTTPLDDTARFDLTRETKQALAYAGIGAALVPASQRERAERRGRSDRWLDMRRLGTAMHDTVDAFARLGGYAYVGLDPPSFEPVFATGSGRYIGFDGLPTHVRHLVAFAAITTRTLWAAYPGQDPREMEGVALIDEIDLHQDPAVHSRIVETLRSTLPRVQWILATSSAALAASANHDDVLALRRLPEDERVELFLGPAARTH
jgi:hypothetical protein